jgi:hypothetical protein
MTTKTMFVVYMTYGALRIRSCFHWQIRRYVPLYVVFSDILQTIDWFSSRQDVCQGQQRQELSPAEGA